MSSGADSEGGMNGWGQALVNAELNTVNQLMVLNLFCLVEFWGEERGSELHASLGVISIKKNRGACRKIQKIP